MATVDNLTLEITADSRKAVQAIDQLSMAMKTLKTNMPTSAKLENTAKGFKALTTEISKLSLSAKNLDKIKAIGTIAKNLNKLNTVDSGVIRSTAKGITSLSNAVSGISYESILKLERLTKALSNMPEKVSISGVRKAASVINGESKDSETSKSESKTGSASAKTLDNATISLDKFWTKYSTISQMIKGNPIRVLANAEDTEKMTKLSETLGMSVGAVTKLSSALGTAGIVFSVVSSAVGVFTNAIKKVLTPIQKFIKSLGRIAMYRALRSILKGISQGLREGIQNLALYSKALDGLDTHNANEVLSRYASAFLYVKNAIATAVMPVLRALIPLVEQAMFRLVDFINIITQVGSAFFGTNFTKAKYFWVDYADSLDNATGRAKALHHQLAQFDELNNLSAPSSGGSGSDKLADASNMFEEAQIDEKIKGIVDKITNAFNTVKEMFEPVKKIVDKVKEVFELSWEKVAPNLKRIWTTLKGIWNNTLQPFIKGLIDGFVDGFLSSDAFKGLPDLLEKLSTIVANLFDEWANLTKIHTPEQWERLGRAIGFVAGWLVELISYVVTSDIKFSDLWDRIKKLGQYMTQTFAPEIAATKIILGYLKDKVGEAITKFIEFINPVNSVKGAIDYAKTSFENFKGVVERLIDKLITNKDTLQQLKDKGDAIRDFFTKNNIFGQTADHADTLWSKLFNTRTELKNTEDKAIGLKNWFNNNPLFAQAQQSAELFKAIIDGIKSVLDGLKNFTCNIGFNYSTSGSVPSTQPSSSGSSTTTTTTTTTANNNNKTTTTTTKTGTQSTGQKPNTTQNTTSGRPATSSSSSNGNYGGFGSLQEYIQAQKKKALGGFVPTGDLFIANEKGAEMIGSIGGNTAVANNNQITEAIAQATYTAMTKALAENGGSVNIVVEGDGDRMFKVFQKKQRENARTMGLAY